MYNQDLFPSPHKMKSVMDSQMNKLLKDTDLKSSQVPFILTIGEDDGCSMKDLCITLGIDKGLVTRVVQTLIKNGFVVNENKNGKKYCLSLTDKGWEAFKTSTDVIDHVIEDLMNILDEDEVAALGRITAKINKKLDELYKY